MLSMSPEIAEVIMQNGNSLDILKVANTQGFQSLRRSGLKKVAEGVTSLEEMNRVIKV
jgi:type IV pilus assembly protein PilB